MTLALEKKCKECNKSKSLDLFCDARKGLFGKSSKCKDCYHNYYLIHKNHILERAKDYYQKNREIIIYKVREYANKNQDEIKRRKSNAYNKHRDDVLKKQKIYRLAHREKISERRKYFYYKNHDSVLAQKRLSTFKFREKYNMIRRGSRDRIRSVYKIYYENNPDIFKKYRQRNISALSNYYIKSQLIKSQIPITEKTIKLKRARIQISRTIKRLKHEVR